MPNFRKSPAKTKKAPRRAQPRQTLLTFEELEPRIMLAREPLLLPITPAPSTAVIAAMPAANARQSPPGPVSAREVFALPGRPGQTAPVRFTLTELEAGYANELGIVLVDNAAGRIGKFRPSDAGYAAAVLRSPSLRVLF